MIPDFQSILRPALSAHEGTPAVHTKDLVQGLAGGFDLDDADRADRLGSGALRFANRVAWSVTHLVKARLLERSGRGVTRITDRGVQALADHTERIDMKLLATYPEYAAWRAGEGPGTLTAEPAPATTPEEVIDAALAEAHSSLADELLLRIMAREPAFFEHLVLELLVAMGYGGSIKEAASHLGKSGDGGVDGIVRRDHLGLDVIYVQAKRRDPEATIHRPDVNAFVGALTGAGAVRGVLFSTASFSQGALDYARTVPTPQVVLVDGAELAALMIRHGVGVTAARRFELRRVDEDFFIEPTD